MKKMKKILILVILILVLLSGCGKEKEPADEPVRTVETSEVSEGAFLSSFTIYGHDIYVYQPEDLMHGDIINYGYSAPLLLVFGDKKMSKEEAVSFICEKDIDDIAQKNGGFVVFVNPLKNWDKEKTGTYEKILEKTMVGQAGFSHGLIRDTKNGDYYLFASPAKTILCGYGKGADYLAENYIRECTGTSSMSSLGSDDITPTAIVLEKLSKEPVIQSEEILLFTDTGTPFEEIYDRHIAKYQRWNGKLTETADLSEEGLTMEPLVFEVETSSDNKVINTPSYTLGAVIWSKEYTGKKRALVMCFHGGGDTAITTASLAGWPGIAAQNDFILCAIEMHTNTTATETIEVIEKLKELYDIDETRIYATGFSMGGIKTWDLYQEYPEVFAALAPMGATVEVGQNTQFSFAPRCNEDVMVPVFMSGGENSPLQELPYQSQTVINRVNYLFRVNGIDVPFELTMRNRGDWTDSKYGYEGDVVEELIDDAYPDSLSTIRSYRSTDGNIYTALCSISQHAHEIRPFTCEKAWEFMKKYRRKDGSIVIEE